MPWKGDDISLTKSSSNIVFWQYVSSSDAVGVDMRWKMGSIQIQGHGWGKEERGRDLNHSCHNVSISIHPLSNIVKQLLISGAARKDDYLLAARGDLFQIAPTRH